MHWIIEVTAAKSSPAKCTFVPLASIHTCLQSLADNHLALRHFDTSRIVSVSSRTCISSPRKVAISLCMCGMRRVGQKTPDPFKCQITFYAMLRILGKRIYNVRIKGEPRAFFARLYVCTRTHAYIVCTRTLIVRQAIGEQRGWSLLWLSESFVIGTEVRVVLSTATIPLPRPLCRLGISCANDFCVRMIVIS